MDLRPYINSQHRLDVGVSLIRRGLLGYQPFLLSEDIEVGEGYNLCTKYAGVESVYDLNAYAKGIDLGRKQPIDVGLFRRCNAEYRQIYEYVCDQIEAKIGVQGLSFAEIGCNTGLLLFMLAKRGAADCYGYDWTGMSPVFSWLNGVLGTDVRFRRGVYSNLSHRFLGPRVKEADVMINTVFLNHQCDPLQFLCFLCDRASKGVFLWVLVDGEDKCGIFYPETTPHDILERKRAFPLSFNNAVAISEPLLRVSLSRLGFDEFVPIARFEPCPTWSNFQDGFRMFFARRTRDVKSAYWRLGNERLAVTQESLLARIEPLFYTKLWTKVLRPIKKAVLG